MKKSCGLLILFACALAAQTVETIPFRAVLSPANEVPAIAGLDASGAATVWAHIMRDASGQVVSGSVDFDVQYQFPGEVTLTGLHIHSGAAGGNGPVRISSGLSSAQPIENGTGRGAIARQGQVGPDDTAGLDTLRGMLANPAAYYVNLHSSANPGGAIRGQLQRAEMVVLMAMMSPSNEVPPIPDLNASGVVSVIALATRDASGALTSGQVVFDVNYTGFPADTAFTGFHIHDGQAGANGPVTISSGIRGGADAVPAGSGGAGNLHYAVEVPISSEASAETLNGLFLDPENYYINLHTMVNPGGAIRNQLRRTDRMSFQVSMLPSNEVPPVTGLEARGNAQITVHTLRAADGSVAAGVVVFDVDYRFPEMVQFTGLHIHDGKAETNGPVMINSGITGSNPVISEAGFGDIYRVVTVSAASGIATLNSLVLNPEDHYVNLHSTVNPAGVVRAQVAAADTAMPSVTAVISSVSDPSLRTVAPLGLMTIFGKNLMKVPTDLSGFKAPTAPVSLNGTEVTIGGRKAPLLTLGREPQFNPPDYLVVQVPAETQGGAQTVTVRNSNGEGSASSTTVAAVAPALYFDAISGVAFKITDLSRVRPNNPAHAGEMIAVLGTGLGQTTPPLATGQFVPFPPLFNAGTVTVTIGGQNATTMGSYAVPNFVGFYFTVVQVPAGLPAGNAPLVLHMGAATSNTIMIPIG
jgi:uncharacterized protein (TIGR03437 family)